MVMIGMLLLVMSTSSARQEETGVSATVKGVSFSGVRLVEAARTLARQYKIVIHVSGVLIGPDDRLIDVLVPNGTVAEVLDALVTADPRFEWSESGSGSVALRLKGTRLSLLDVVADIEAASLVDRRSLIRHINELPAVEEWLSGKGCQMSEIMAIVGRPRPQAPQLTIPSGRVPLWALLDELARQTGSYFWSAIQYGKTPCEVNLSGF